MAHRDFQWRRYLQHRNIDPTEVSDNSLSCPQSPENGEIQAAITTLGNRPYIPGSTLKGAIRTALLEEILSENDRVYQHSLDHLNNLIDRDPRGNPRREHPARTLEQLAFGKDPNHDLLRTLHVGDTLPLDSDALEIGMLWTLTPNENNQLVQKIDSGREYKHFVQHLRIGQLLTFTLKIDRLLMRDREKEHLGFTDSQAEMLSDIAEVCRSTADVLLNKELNFFHDYNLPEIANVYDKLIHLNNYLPEGSFLLQIGAGTGYHTNTVTALFTEGTTDAEAPVDIMDFRERFRLGASRSRRGHYDEREFPKTRRILYQGRNPIAPSGWVKISPLQD